MEKIKDQIQFEIFSKVDIRIGTITKAEVNEKARKPALLLNIDFGELGTKTSSAQITDYYSANDLIGTQVVAVVNFPPVHIGVKSEVLVLGGIEEDGKVILLKPERKLNNGLKIG